MSFFGETSKKIIELVREINQMTVRIEHVEKKSDYTLTECKNLIERLEARREQSVTATRSEIEGLRERICVLEAKMTASVDSALLITTREAVMDVVREAMTAAQPPVDVERIQTVVPGARVVRTAKKLALQSPRDGAAAESAPTPDPKRPPKSPDGPKGDSK
jgi:hypothetical protein